MELVCQTEIALELSYIEQSEYEELIKMATNLSVKMSNFLRNIASPKGIPVQNIS